MKICKYDKRKLAICPWFKCTEICICHPSNIKYRKDKGWIKDDVL